MKSNSSAITTVVFDLGGVLIDWNPRYLYRKIFTTENEIENFLENVCTFDWNEMQDGGRSFKDATLSKIKEFPEFEKEIAAFYERWPEMLGGPIEPVVEILQKIYSEKKFRLLALTNWSSETFPVAQKRYDFLNLFEGVVVSGEEKLKKPDPKIYQRLLDRYKLQPNECLFIDDSERNTNAAAQMGFHIHRYQSHSLLNKYLQESKII